MRILDLFCGAGGFSLGFQWAKLPVTTAVENFRPVAETYRENFPYVELHATDAQKLSFPERSHDLVIGGPPCEPFTAASSVREADPLDRLYKNKIGGLVLHFVRLVAKIQPKAFVMENVVQVAEGPLEGALREEYTKAGYPQIHFNKLHAEDYGTPSRRTRLFVSNLELKPPRTSKKIVPVAKVLAGLPEPGQGDIPNHHPHPLSKEKRLRISQLAPGHALYNYRAGSGKIHQNWLRLHPESVAPTITGNGRFVHPTKDRLLTVREHARFMGFPDDFVFRGGRKLQYDQVGEAVPPPLSRAIALEISKAARESRP